MQPFRDGLIPPLLHAVRIIVDFIRRQLPDAALAWLVWLLSVALFAIWTLFHYKAPAEPAWIGMTIHTSVFAFWTLILYEWFLWRFGFPVQ